MSQSGSLTLQITATGDTLVNGLQIQDLRKMAQTRADLQGCQLEVDSLDQIQKTLESIVAQDSTAIKSLQAENKAHQDIHLQDSVIISSQGQQLQGARRATTRWKISTGTLLVLLIICL